MSISTDSSFSFTTLLHRGWKRFKKEGVLSLWRRLLEEISIPTSPTGRLLKVLVSMPLLPFYGLRNVLIRLLAGAPVSTKTLYAFYDLQVEPVSFDFAWFLTCAELARRKFGMNSIHVVIVPAREQRPLHKHDNQDAPPSSADTSTNEWRISNILLPSVSLLPCSSGVTLCHNRMQASVLCAFSQSTYPYNYKVLFPTHHYPGECVQAGHAGENNVSCLRAPKPARNFVAQWLQRHPNSRKIVSITLRESRAAPGRNSNIAAWHAFATAIAKQGFTPVFIRDTEVSLDEAVNFSNEFTTFDLASWNVLIRSAFYEQCYLNMGVNNGPMATCWLNADIRYLTFKMVAADSRDTTLETFRVRGLDPLSSLSFATPYQKYVWKNDDVDTLMEEFTAMCKVIDSART